MVTQMISRFQECNQRLKILIEHRAAISLELAHLWELRRLVAQAEARFLMRRRSAFISSSWKRPTR
jgi:hypothetical protein